jgi:hypothetical protein
MTIEFLICHCKRKTSVIIYLFHCQKRRKKYCLDEELEYVRGEDHSNMMVAWRPKGSLCITQAFPLVPWISMDKLSLVQDRGIS